MKNNLLTGIQTKVVLVVITMFVTYYFTGFTQVKGQKKDVKPTKQELEQMKKEIEEMEEEMEDMDPEEIEMLKKMGVQMPDMKNISKTISGLSESDLQNAWNDEGKLIPEKDIKRISFATSKKLTDAGIGDYIKQVHSTVLLKLGKDVTSLSDEIIASGKSAGSSGAQIANGLWVFGANAPAIIILGKTITSGTAGPNELNNYAAFLVMAGAEEAALPILTYLNNKYPRNSTILNNMGQAWFGLGDLDKATAFFDSALALYPGHSQANFTKSVIQEHKGDLAGALSSMKRSIKTGYSQAKEKRLGEMNYTLKGSDITWSPPFPQDPLGFGQMNWPGYPKTVEESEKLEKEWEDYRANLNLKSLAIEAKFEKAVSNYEAFSADPGKMMNYLVRMNLRLQKTTIPFTSKARAGLEYYNESNENAALARYESLLQNQDSVQLNVRKLEEKYGKELDEQHKIMAKYIGEGASEAQMIAYCQARDKINSNYLEQANRLLEDENIKWIEYWRKAMSRRLNYFQYSLPPEAFEMEKLRAQLMWLGFIGGQEVIFTDKCSIGQKPASIKPASKKLADFYDMNCNQKSVAKYGVGTISLECNKMTIEVDAWIIKYSSRENMDNGTIIRGTVEVGFDVPGSKSVELGPVKAEIKTGGSLFIEFDNEGVTDAGVKVGASAEVGTNVVPSGMPTETGISDQSITVVGAEAKWGWNSGGSLTGKGLLSGLSL